LPPWIDGELLGFDLETTGVDPRVDVPVSFALVRAVAGVASVVRSGLVDPGREIPSEAVAIHGISSERAAAEGMALGAATDLITEALLDAGRRGVPVVGMNVVYDLTMADALAVAHSGAGLVEAGFAGAVLDVLVLDRHVDRYRRGHRRLDDLCLHYGVARGVAHDAGCDVEATIGVLRALVERYPEIGAMDLVALSGAQVSWHREWAESYSAWRVEHGQSALEAHEVDWPIARAREGRPGSGEDRRVEVGR
jgi:DNA polymerase-3 subunit epsilon